MRLKDAREALYYQSGKAGDVGRQLALGGIAVVWLLHGPASSLAFPKQLLIALGAFLASLAMDFLQYFFATAIWGVFSWNKERDMQAAGIDPTSTENKAAEFLAPRPINWWVMFTFAVKGSALIAGGVVLGLYLWSKIASSS